MGSATEEQPKCLTILEKKPLIYWQIKALEDCGISEIAIVTGYRHQLLEPFGCHHFHNERWATTNMVMSLATAADWLRHEPCIVSYSDIVYGSSAPAALMERRNPLTITYDRLWELLWRLRFENPLDDAETFVFNKNGDLVEIGNKPQTLDQIMGQYMGLMAITPEGWDHIESTLAGLIENEKDKLDMTSLLNRLLKTGVTVDTCPVNGKWCEVDSPSDLNAYNQVLAKPGKWSHDWR